MIDARAGLYSTKSDIDRSSSSFSPPAIRNSVARNPTKRMLVMTPQLISEKILPMIAFACSFAFIAAIVLSR